MAPSARFRAPPAGKELRRHTPKYRFVYSSPSLLPLGLGPPRSRAEGGYKLSSLECRRNDYEFIEVMTRPYLRLNSVGAGLSRAAPGRSGSFLLRLILFLARFLAGSLASESSFHPLFLARLQVKGVSLDLLDNVFLLYLTLEAAQSVLEGFTLLKPYFCQTDTPPDSSGRTE
jgi:hypothetical protein